MDEALLEKGKLYRDSVNAQPTKPVGVSFYVRFGNVVVNLIWSAARFWSYPSCDCQELEALCGDDGRGSRGVDPWQIRCRQ